MPTMVGTSALVLLWLTAAPARAGDLRRELAAIASEEDGTTGVAVVHLGRGDAVDVNGDERFPMQSVYKLPIAIAALAAVERGRLRLEDEVTITAADISHGPDPSLWAELPRKVTIGHLVEVMIVGSDNTACDNLIKLLGGPGAITRLLRQRGIRDVTVSRPERQIAQEFCKDSGAADCNQATAEQKRRAIARQVARGLDLATPKAMAALLVALARGRLLGPEQTTHLLDLMTRSTSGKNRLKALLPPGTPVAHRSGTGSLVVNHVGLITLPGGDRVAIAVFLKGSDRAPPERERTIARLGRATYDFYAPAPTR